jgi:hypothetical protein
VSQDSHFGRINQKGTIAAVMVSRDGLAGCFMPVRRATRINAMEALRRE